MVDIEQEILDKIELEFIKAIKGVDSYDGQVFYKPHKFIDGDKGTLVVNGREIKLNKVKLGDLR